MIKKPTKFTGTVDVDDDSVASPSAAETATPEAMAKPSETIADDDIRATDHFDDLDHNYNDDPDALEDVTAPPRKNANWILYVGGAAVFIVVAAIAYPQFSAMMGPKHSQSAAVAPFPTTTPPHRNPMGGFGGSSALPAAPGPETATTQAPAAPNPTPASDQSAASPSAPSAPNSIATAILTPPPATATVSAPTPTPAPASGTAVKTLPTLTPPTTASLPASATQVPASAAAADTRVDDLTNKVNALQTTVKALTDQENAESPQLQKIQASLEALQTQVAQLSENKAPVAYTKPVKETVKLHYPAGNTIKGNSSNWVLRSATPGMALIGHAGNNELQRVAMGDTISGIGRITAISEVGGRWVVQGTKGSISQ